MAEINVDEIHGRYEVDAEALERIKSLSDADFEKEVAKFSENVQTFLRIARDHNHKL